MRHRLDQRQTVFPLANGPFEQGRKTRHSGAGHLQMIQQAIKGGMVVINHLLQPKGQAR
ncbi:MAG: hypothetical protein RIT52_1778, partial [Pseudomonadota bacterium]